MWHKQGNIGMGEAIRYFTREGYVVSLPLNDSQWYDIIVEKDGNFKIIQVKSVSFSIAGVSRVTVKTSTVTQGGTKHYKYLNPKIDLIFIHDLNTGFNYLVPNSESLPKTQWKLDEKFDKFKV